MGQARTEPTRKCHAVHPIIFLKKGVGGRGGHCVVRCVVRRTTKLHTGHLDPGGVPENEKMLSTLTRSSCITMIIINIIIRYILPGVRRVPRIKFHFVFRPDPISSRLSLVVE